MNPLDLSALPFPGGLDDIRIEIRPKTVVGMRGHTFRVLSPDGRLLAEGWSAGNKREARAEALHATAERARRAEERAQ